MVTEEIPDNCEQDPKPRHQQEDLQHREERISEAVIRDQHPASLLRSQGVRIGRSIVPRDDGFEAVSEIEDDDWEDAVEPVLRDEIASGSQEADQAACDEQSTERRRADDRDAPSAATDPGAESSHGVLGSLGGDHVAEEREAQEGVVG